MIAALWSDVVGSWRDPLTFWGAISVGAAVAVASTIAIVLGWAGRIDEELRREILLRCATWAVLVPLILGPILLGATFVAVAVGLLGLGCYREYARATGLFRSRLVHLLVVLGIAAVALAAVGSRDRLYVALCPLMIGLIAVGSVLTDRPRGYLQRTGLGVLGFALFGACLGYVSLLANHDASPGILIWLFLGVELNDVLAFVTGKLIGGPKLRPNTSPNKTIAGAVGAIVLTTALVAGVGHVVFAGQPIDRPLHLLTLGVIVSVAGQLGDLVVSSIKRDLGIKDMAAALPGHGGLLDRFDSLLLVAPAVYYYLQFVQAGGAEPLQP